MPSLESQLDTLNEEGDFQLEFTPFREQILLPKQEQLKLFGEARRRRSHVRMGDFYEMLSSSLFGGKLHDTDGDWRTGQGCNPDIISERQKLIIESKANRIGHQLNLLDEQVERYRNLQLSLPNHRILYTIWRHKFQNIKAFSGTSTELFDELSTCTVACVVLSFSLILSLWRIRKESLGRKRYETDKWYHCTRVGSKLTNRFLTEPECVLRDLGEDPGEFQIEGFRSSPSLRVNGAPMCRFYIRTCTDKRHKAFFDKEFGADKVPF